MKDPGPTPTQGWGTMVKRGICYRCMPTYCSTRLVVVILIIGVIMSAFYGVRLFKQKSIRTPQKDAKRLGIYDKQWMQKMGKSSPSRFSDDFRQSRWNKGKVKKTRKPLQKMWEASNKGSDPLGRRFSESYKPDTQGFRRTGILDDDSYKKVNANRLPESINISNTGSRKWSAYAHRMTTRAYKSVGSYGTKRKPPTQMDSRINGSSSKKPMSGALSTTFFRGTHIGTTKRTPTSEDVQSIPSDKDLQQIRKERITKVCSLRVGSQLPQKQNGISWLEHARRLTDLTKSHILVDTKHKLLYCSIPNTASSLIIRKLLVMNGHHIAPNLGLSNITRSKKLSLLLDHGVRPLKKYATEDIAYMMEKYFSFTFVRDPFDRLWTTFNKYLADPRKSAYKTGYIAAIKMAAMEYDKHGPLFGRSMMGAADLRSERPSQATPAVLGDVTFWQFLKYLTRTPPSVYDENWQTYNSLCDPCNVQYKFIGKTETLKADLARWVKKIETGPFTPLKDKAAIPVKVLRTGSPRLWKALGRIYREDMKLFAFKNRGILGGRIKGGLTSKMSELPGSPGLRNNKTSGLRFRESSNHGLGKIKTKPLDLSNIQNFHRGNSKKLSKDKGQNDNSDSAQSFTRSKRLGTERFKGKRFK